MMNVGLGQVSVNSLRGNAENPWVWGASCKLPQSLQYSLSDQFSSAKPIQQHNQKVSGFTSVVVG
jgi:hypothetical protein